MRLFYHRPSRLNSAMASVHVITRKIIILLFHFLVITIIANGQGNPDVESDALLRLKVSFNNAGVLLSWQPGTSPCSETKPWEGIRCEGGSVQGIRLEGLNLSGIVDIDALLQIPMLRTISLMSNSFSGPIPAFNQLVQLKALYLTNNHFEGEIPDDYFVEMKSLKKLWLSWNDFSGPIPSSLDMVPLLELFLENNKFSGSIPPLNQESIQQLGMAHNNLTGPIPPGLSRFDAKIFEGNPGLCGPQVGNPCAEQPNEPPPPPPTKNEIEETAGHPNATSLWIMLAAMVILIIMIIGIIYLRRKQKKNEDSESVFNEMNDPEGTMQEHKLNGSGKMMAVPKDTSISLRENSEVSSTRGVLNGEVPSTNRFSNAASEVSSINPFSNAASEVASTNRVSSAAADLTMVNDEKGEFYMSDLMKASAEVLGNSNFGSSYKAIISNDFTVVVKRVKGMERLEKDAFNAEIRNLASINHTNVLAPLAYHYRRAEKLLITEYMPKGSLLYVLHGDKRSPKTELQWPVRLNIIQGIARGLLHIHTELGHMELPHGNLKSSNVLLSPEYEPLLSDYGLNSLVTSVQAKQALFAYKSPEALQNQSVSPKSDVYCMGIIILELLTGKFPFQYVTNGKGGTDVGQWARSSIDEGREVDILDPNIGSSLSSLQEMKHLLHIGVACTEPEPRERLDMREAMSRIEALHYMGRTESSRQNSRERTSFGIS